MNMMTKFHTIRMTWSFMKIMRSQKKIQRCMFMMLSKSPTKDTIRVSSENLSNLSKPMAMKDIKCILLIF